MLKDCQLMAARSEAWVMVMAAPALLTLAEPALTCAPVGKAVEDRVWAQAMPAKPAHRVKGAIR